MESGDRSSEVIVEDLLREGFSIQPKFLNLEVVNLLSKEIDALKGEGKLRRAGIGRKEALRLDDETRGDEICWWEQDSLTTPQRSLWSALEALRQSLNRTLFLGARSMEGHYALYPAGAKYKKHLDRFQSDDARVLSVVIYLNPEWSPEWGGQLALHADAEIQVQPEPGTMVCFLSDKIPHEVRAADHIRKSFAGWFRR